MSNRLITQHYIRKWLHNLVHAMFGGCGFCGFVLAEKWRFKLHLLSYSKKYMASDDMKVAIPTKLQLFVVMFYLETHLSPLPGPSFSKWSIMIV